jgi:hypothetical protein
MTALQSHASKYTPSCLMMLREERNLPLSQMNNVRVCALVSKEHPESLDFDINELTMEDIQVPTVAAGQVSLIANLHHLTPLIPKYYTGNAIMQGINLFDHMCHFQNMKHAAAKEKDGTKTRYHGWNHAQALELIFTTPTNILQSLLGGNSKRIHW